MKTSPTKKETSVVIEILRRQKSGIDCSESESCKIKAWVKAFSNNMKNIDVERDIQGLLPIEYSEAIDELTNPNYI